MSAVRNSDGSVTVNGVRLSAAQVREANTALTTPPPVKHPLVITTGSGKVYGKTGVPRYGIAMDPATGSYHFLDANWDPIPNTSWKVRNLNRMKILFSN